MKRRSIFALLLIIGLCVSSTMAHAAGRGAAGGQRAASDSTEYFRLCCFGPAWVESQVDLLFTYVAME
jgi:hypothetical protein